MYIYLFRAIFILFLILALSCGENITKPEIQERQPKIKTIEELPQKTSEKTYRYKGAEYHAEQYKTLLLLERNEELLDSEHHVTAGYKYSVFLFVIINSEIMMPYSKKFSKPIGDSDYQSSNRLSLYPEQKQMNLCVTENSIEIC